MNENLVENPTMADMSELRESASDLLDYLDNLESGDDNVEVMHDVLPKYEHQILEDAITAFCGKGVWDRINKLMP